MRNWFAGVAGALIVALVGGCGGGGGGTAGADLAVEEGRGAVDVGTELSAELPVPAADASVDGAPMADGEAVDGAGDGGGDLAAEAFAELPPADIQVEPDPLFERWCLGNKWDSELAPATLHEVPGELLGVYKEFPALTMETSKVIAAHPFQVTGIRLAVGGTGKVRIQLMHTFGRSYPASWEKPAEPWANLTEPVDLVVTDADPEEWLTIDLADRGIFLEPTQHYMLVFRHFDTAPYLAVAKLSGPDDYSRGLILVPNQFEPYGLGDANYRFELVGNYFCQWSAEQRWFAEQMTGAFRLDGSNRVSVADIDGDGHDDFVSLRERPVAWFGDGEGGFTESATPLFPAGLGTNMVVLGDLDNDGDADAFAATWVGWDSDGDGVTIVDGDCNDTVAAIHLGAEEVAGNGIDDDCDGVTDDGVGDGDGDGDGFSVADGDGHDGDGTIFPGAPELLDGKDNDCDLGVDEDFPNRILLNEGAEGFVPVADSGVETLDPTGSAALGDGNNDGLLDVYWGNWLKRYPDAPAVDDRYAIGLGGGQFLDATEAAGLVKEKAQPCYGVTWVDYDNDGHQDIWVGNYQFKPNFLWHNQGDGTFVDVAESLGLHKDDKGYQGGHTYGGDWADFDNDGDFDLFEPNLSHPRTMPASDDSRLLVNQGPPGFTFVDRFDELGFSYDEGDVNAAFGDYDNDGDLDLVISSLYQGHYSKFYRNDGEAGFVDITYETGSAVHDAVGAAWSDVDEDGDLDLFLMDRVGEQRIQLYINGVGSQQHWLELKLVGVTANRDAVGARVTLVAGGQQQLRAVRGGGRHMNAQDSHIVHFGLGATTAVESVTVHWPGGEAEQIKGLTVNGRWLVVQGTGGGEPY